MNGRRGRRGDLPRAWPAPRAGDERVPILCRPGGVPPPTDLARAVPLVGNGAERRRDHSPGPARGPAYREHHPPTMICQRVVDCVSPGVTAAADFRQTGMRSFRRRWTTGGRRSRGRGGPDRTRDRTPSPSSLFVRCQTAAMRALASAGAGSSPVCCGAISCSTSRREARSAVGVRGRRAHRSPPYYARGMTAARPLNRLVTVAIVITVIALVGELIRNELPPSRAILSLALTLAAIRGCSTTRVRAPTRRAPYRAAAATAAPPVAGLTSSAGGARSAPA
jgi:hypothetical protein